MTTFARVLMFCFCVAVVQADTCKDNCGNRCPGWCEEAKRISLGQCKELGAEHGAQMQKICEDAVNNPSDGDYKEEPCDDSRCTSDYGSSDSGNKGDSPSESSTPMLYKVSNNGNTTWRPTVAEILVYSDASCTVKISATYAAQSGTHGISQDGSQAFDTSKAFDWRPQCKTCSIGEAWVTFSTVEKVQCVQAKDLGKGQMGDNTWDGGIKVEVQAADGSWSVAMESTTGNQANAKKATEAEAADASGTGQLAFGAATCLIVLLGLA